MLKVRLAALTAIALAGAGCGASKAPSLPRASGHQTVTVVARGVPTPTAFARFAGRLFVAGYGVEHNPSAAGGVYVLGGGKATRVPGSPGHVFGLAAGKNTLLVKTCDTAGGGHTVTTTMVELQRGQFTVRPAPRRVNDRRPVCLTLRQNLRVGGGVMCFEESARCVGYPGELRPGCPRRRSLRSPQPRRSLTLAPGLSSGPPGRSPGARASPAKDRVASLPSTDP